MLREENQLFGEMTMMKTRHVATIALASLSCLSMNGCGESRVESLFASMRSGKYYKQYDRHTFPDVGTEDIPVLLRHATKTNRLPAFSFPHGGGSLLTCSCTEGMVALWLIEGIRIGGRFPSSVPVCYDTGKETARDLLFHAEADQQDVVKVYSSWWQKAQGQPGDVSPLEGTSLTWSCGRGRAATQTDR